MEKEIEFTQYLLPDGRKTKNTISRPEAVADKAQAIVSAGYTLELEVLTTGQVSMAIHDSEKGEDLAIEICGNGPEVLIHVDKLINDFVIPE